MSVDPLACLKHAAWAGINGSLAEINVESPYSARKYTGDESVPFFFSTPVSVKCFNHLYAVERRSPNSSSMSRRVRHLFLDRESTYKKCLREE